MADLKNEEWYSKVVAYFDGKAEKYDLTDEQIYWVLSDKLLWTAIRKVFLESVKESGERVKILDAGGGTGRWSIKIGKFLGNLAEIHLVDISTEMLRVADKKIKREGLDNIKLIHLALERLLEVYNQEYFDYTLCLHNVLGFVKDPEEVLRILSRVTKRGIILFVPNYYHMLYFNISVRGTVDHALEVMKNKMGKFVDNMPEIHVFTPLWLEKTLEKFGFNPVVVSGFPKFIYPGKEETKIVGNSQDLKKLLKDPQVFEKIFLIEHEHLFDRDSATRGNMIFVYGEK